MNNKKMFTVTVGLEVRACYMWVYLEMWLMKLTPFFHIIVYVSHRKPFKFQCQQKESSQIMNKETGFNNTVKKTHI